MKKKNNQEYDLSQNYFPNPISSADRGRDDIKSRKIKEVKKVKNKKRILRIATFFSFLMFLLIPLMSTPVAAAFTDNTNVTTNNPPSGVPTIIITPQNNRAYRHIGGTPPTATFTVSYSFSDNNPPPGGMGSIHFASLTVTPPAASVNSGFVNIAAGGGTVTGTLTIGPLTYTVPGPPTTWTVDIYVSVTDIANSNTVTASASFQVTVW